MARMRLQSGADLSDFNISQNVASKISQLLHTHNLRIYWRVKQFDSTRCIIYRCVGPGFLRSVPVPVRSSTKYRGPALNTAVQH